MFSIRFRFIQLSCHQLTRVIAGVKIEIMEEGEGLRTKRTLVRFTLGVLPSNMAVEIILSSKGALAKLANEIFRDVRIVSVEMLSEFILVEERFAALATVERFVLLVPQQMRHDFLSIRINLLANAATVSDVLFVILSMSDHVVQREIYVRAHDAVVISLRV